MIELLQILGGIALLYLGGEALVGSASRLARKWGVSPMMVGLTVVAAGTSSPELFASLAAALRGTPELALGNVIGSNIANIGLILGVTGLISPIRTTGRFVRREVAFMVAVAFLLLLLVVGGSLGRIAGAVLTGLLAAYLLLLLRGQEKPEVEAEFEREYGATASRTPVLWLGVIAGLGLLAGGANLLVSGATELARDLGVSDLVIGLSMVAVGTSLPELFASVIAALRQEADIALGNVVGSNVLNVLFVLGPTALVAPFTVAPGSSAPIDAAVGLTLSLVLLPFLRSGMRLGRRESLLLLLGYCFYLYSLFALT